MKQYSLALFLFIFACSVTNGQKMFRKDGRTKQGDCFCSSGAKSKGSWYVGAYGKMGIGSYDDEEKSSFPVGVHLGVNLTEIISVQVGAAYNEVREVNGPEGFSQANYDFVDFRIDGVLRFPNEQNGIIPYLSIGLNNNNILKSIYQQDGLFPSSQENNEFRFNANYLRIAGGIYVVLNDKLSLFTEPFLLTKIGDKPQLGFTNLYGLGLGLNYHF